MFSRTTIPALSSKPPRPRRGRRLLPRRPCSRRQRRQPRWSR